MDSKEWSYTLLMNNYSVSRQSKQLSKPAEQF